MCGFAWSTNFLSLLLLFTVMSEVFAETTAVIRPNHCAECRSETEERVSKLPGEKNIRYPFMVSPFVVLANTTSSTIDLSLSIISLIRKEKSLTRVYLIRTGVLLFIPSWDERSMVTSPLRLMSGATSKKWQSMAKKSKFCLSFPSVTFNIILYQCSLSIIGIIFPYTKEQKFVYPKMYIVTGCLDGRKFSSSPS